MMGVVYHIYKSCMNKATCRVCRSSNFNNWHFLNRGSVCDRYDLLFIIRTIFFCMLYIFFGRGTVAPYLYAVHNMTVK